MRPARAAPVSTIIWTMPHSKQQRNPSSKINPPKFPFRESHATPTHVDRSREAAQECRQRRKPWEEKRKNDQAAERRKIIATEFSPRVSHTKWNQAPEGR